jgi:phosphoribosyl 1,2-cyclic phosphodiesterase
LLLTLLGSGSSGNVAYLAAMGTRVLVDAGLPKSEIEARLARVCDADGPVALESIDAVLVTHQHGDHAGCAAQLGRPLWATAATQSACGLCANTVRAGQPFTVGALTITPVALPHDAEETVGYVIGDGRAKVGILTDCGHDAADVAVGYAGCDLLVLETNHDPSMLKWGSYPPTLKRRVGGRLGHLSNEQAASLLKQMCAHGPAPKLVIAAHLSQANNRPMLAKRALDRVLGRNGRVLIATQAFGSPVLTIVNGRVVREPERREQLTFDFMRAG